MRCFVFVLSLLAIFCTSGIVDAEDECMYTCRMKPLQNHNDPEADYNVSPSGNLTVTLKLADVKVTDYWVKLRVINGTEHRTDCESVIFSKPNYGELQESNICVLNSSDNSTRAQGAPFCQDGIELSYGGIFTGCYSLLLRNQREERPLASKFLDPNCYYAVHEPTYTCRYSNITVDNVDDSSEVKTTVRLVITTDGRPKNIQFEMKRVDAMYKNKTDACVNYNDNSALHDYTKKLGAICENGTTERRIPRDFNITSKKDDLYCFYLYYTDTGYSHTREPRKYIITCTQVAPRPLSLLEPKAQSHHIYVVVLAAIVCIGCGIVFVRWLVSRPSEQREIEARPIQYQDIPDSVYGEEEDAIVLIYVKDSAPFMELLADFRNALKRCCGVKVHDWYSTSVWDVGVERWVQQKLIAGHRTIWIDTPRARSLVPFRLDENSSAQQELIRDPHDATLAVTVEAAKHVRDATAQYRHFFVVRFEGFEAEEGMDDPFANLSPHTRYHIPRHWVDLFSHLSGKSHQEIQSEEALFREKLK